MLIKCSVCKCTKPSSEFDKETRAKSGFRGTCKVCRSVGKERASNAAYNRRPDIKELRKEQLLKRKQDPAEAEKIAAAVKRGKEKAKEDREWRKRKLQELGLKPPRRKRTV